MIPSKILAEIIPSTKYEIIDAQKSNATKKFLNWCRKTIRAPFFFLAVRAFGPYFLARKSTLMSVRPFSTFVSKCFSTSVTDH
jgi:hypothetical protein